MKHKLVRISYIIFLLVSINTSVLAQVFPIQVNTQVLPPYTPYLADYTAPGTQKFMVQLRANDLALSDYRVKLRLTIEGVNITIRTKQSFTPQQPLIMEGGGAPQVYYGEDLLEYFNPNALDFAGITRSQYEKGAKLPDGLYRFTVEVLDYNRGTVVSNKGTAMAWVILNDPPILNLPRKDLKLQILDPTNIVFTWTPRHSGSPNAAFTTEYVFRLVEIWPANRNPYDAFLSQQVLYEVTTTQPQILYGPAEPLLISGRKYAWQVQARDVDGRDLFKNEGRSEVFAFQFGDALGTPENLRKEAGNASTLSLRWEPPTQGEMPREYRVRYRKKGSITDWYEAVTSQGFITLNSLKEDTEYEVQVRAEAKPQLGEYTTLQSMHTSLQTTTPYACGKENVTPPTENTPPLLMLAPGDVITSRNFRFIVNKTNGENGVFSGEGVVQVPFFNMATVGVVFNGISVNNKYELVAGEIVTAYNPGSEIAQVIDDAHKIGEEKPKPTQPTPDTTTTPAIVPDYTIPGIIESVTVNDKGEIIVKDKGGNETTYEQKKDEKTGKVKETVIADAGGNTYTVGKDGKVSKAENTQGGGLANSSSLSPLDKMILESLGMYKKAIEDYWASTKTVDDNGGTKSLPKLNFRMFEAELPVCLQEHKNDLVLIHDKIGKLEKTDSKEYKQFKYRIEKLIPEVDRNNAERVQATVCKELPEEEGEEFDNMLRSMSLDGSYYKVNDGLIPEYLWKSGLVDPYVAGFVDGLWETIESTWGIVEFMNAWQPMNYSAEAMIIRAQTYQFVQFLNDLAQSAELRSQAWNSVKQSFSLYIDETAALDKRGMYNQGKLIFDVVTLFIGVGEIKAILNGEKLTIGIVALLQAVPKNLSKFIFNVRRFGLSVVKSGNSLLIKDGATQIALISGNVLKPTLYFEAGEELATEGVNTLVKNSKGKYGFVKKTVEDLTTFVNKTLAQKLDDLAATWKAVYPEIFVERKFFEDIMGHYRYTKGSGWGHTADIADNFKAIDFYEEFTVVGNDIFANTAVSMKTTTTKSVDSWLSTNAVKTNLDVLANGLVGNEGISWSGKAIKYTKAEVHIYMPKENITSSLKVEWINKLSTARPGIKFEIYSLEEFIK